MKTLKALEDDAKKKQIKKIILNVFKHNPGAYALYVKTGYHVITDKDSNIIMEKEISIQ